jgi:hypothetical protein
MNPKKNVDEDSLSMPLPRRFVRYILNFFLGLGIGLAPFLGTKNVPGFRALISVMPFQIAPVLIPLSAFLMGLVMVAVQFYSTEQISRSTLRKRFKFALIAMVIGFVLFYYLRGEFTVDVERAMNASTVTVLIGDSTTSDCLCKNPKEHPDSCIQELSFSTAAIASCWDAREIKRRGELLGLSYLVLTSGVGVLIGLVLLVEDSRRQERKRKAQRQRENPTPTKAAPPKTPANDESGPADA